MSGQYTDPMFKVICPHHVEKKKPEKPEPLVIEFQELPLPKTKRLPSVWKPNTSRRDNTIAAIIAIAVLVVWSLPTIFSILGALFWVVLQIWLQSIYDGRHPS